MSIEITRKGSKFMIRGYTYPIKEELKAVGCRWDKANKCWYTEDESVAKELHENPPKETVDLTAKVVIAKALHKGNEYPVVHRKGEGAKLSFTDGTGVFWVKSVEKILEEYDPAISLEEF